MTAMGLAIVLVFSSLLGDQVTRPPSPQAEAVRRVSEADATALRTHSLRLKDILLELNQLAAIPRSDGRYANAQKRIATLSDEVIKQTINIYTVLEKSGVGKAASDLHQRSIPGMLNGLPARERELLAEAGFSRDEIAAISVVIQLRAEELMPRLSAAQQKTEIEKSSSGTRPVGKVLRIGAGALLIGFDIGSQFIPMVNAVTAVAVITSVSSGLVLVADGLETDPKPKPQ